MRVSQRVVHNQWLALLLLLLTGMSSSPALRSTKLFRILRLTRLVKLVRLLKLGRFIGSAEDEVEVNPSIIQMGKMFMQLLFIAHLIGCIWHAMRSSSSDPESDWVTTYFGVDGEGNPAQTLKMAYLSSLYWCVCVCVCCYFVSVSMNESHKL